MGRLSSPPPHKAQAVSCTTASSGTASEKKTSSTIMTQQKHGFCFHSSQLASQISPSILPVMTLGHYKYMLLAFPSFTLLQILPSSAIPGILLNFTPQTWLLTAAHTSGIQHTPASGAGVPMAHDGCCLFTTRSQLLGRFLCLGNLPMSSAHAVSRDSQNLPLHKYWRNISKGPSKKSSASMPWAISLFPYNVTPPQEASPARSRGLTCRR